MNTDELDAIIGLQWTISEMELTYSPKSFFTSDMIVRNYKSNFPNTELTKWELRKLIRQPYFCLTNRGWRSRQRVK